jgi:hypothetical protein
MKHWNSGLVSPWRAFWGVVALLCIAWPLATAEALAQEQTPVPPPPSLAEIARLEQMRRKTVTGPSKVYTDKDLRRAAPAPGPTPASPAGSTAVPDAPAPAGGQPDAAAKGEEAWKSRMSQAREDLRRNEIFLEALQTRINALTSDFVTGEGPYQRAKIGEDRQKALTEFDRVKAEIERGKQAILDIEEEARKAGIPSGWIR